MRSIITIFLFLWLYLVSGLNNYHDKYIVQKNINNNLIDAVQFLNEYDKEASNMCFRVRSAQWSYSTNMTDFNKRKMIEEQQLKAKFDKISSRKAAEFDWTKIDNPVIRRQIRMLMTNNRALLSDDKFNEIYHLISEMKDLYAHIRVCPYSPPSSASHHSAIYCDLELNDIKNIMAKSRDTSELLHIWKEWHDKSGPIMRNKFMRYVELANQAARFNGFSNAGIEMESIYETNNFNNELAQTIQKILPLYKELFTYVRTKLHKKYGTEVIREDGPIPAHILGDLWAQDWSNIYDLVLPYPKFGNIDVSDELLRQSFTPLRIFQMAEEFYTSMGLKSMPPEFWRYSTIEKPVARRMQCTASAWDFCNRFDYRIKQCTEVDMKNLIAAHHEMAHIEYYLYYIDQPFIYRNGANPGFHEGFANAMILSIFNPEHLHRIGLLTNNSDIYESNINFLMYMALKKVAYAPFAYLVDQWRKQIFQYGVTHMNSDWWNLRLRFQGIVPPVLRTEYHFDPAAKRHIPADLAYVKYYVALLLEFQIYKSLCSSIDNNNYNRSPENIPPLHRCDLYRSREAGRIISEMLNVGQSGHWKETIKNLTKGKSSELSADALLEYFQPLLLWLRDANRRENVIGWITNQEDVALYQPLVSRSFSQCCQCSSFVFLAVIVVYLCFILDVLNVYFIN